MSDHPSAETLRRFAEGLLSPDDMATVAIHVAGCEACRKRANGGGDEEQEDRESGTSSPYAGAIRRVARKSAQREARFNRDKRRAPSDLARILALPADEWNGAVRSSPRYLSYAFARQALAASKAGWTDDPYRSERLAELGLFVADRLSTTEHGRRNLNDLRSRAWSYIGNCQRIRTEFREVPDSFEMAIAMHHEGSGGGRDRIQLFSFMQSYLSSLKRYPESVDLTSQVADLTRHYNDSHAEGRNLWARGLIECGWLKQGQAIETLERALGLLNERREPGSTHRLKLNIAAVFTKLETPAAAFSICRSISPSKLRSMGRLDTGRYYWTLAQAHWKMGNSGPTVPLLAQARRHFLCWNTTMLATDVNMDLARVFLQLGQANRAVKLICATFPSLVRRGDQADIVAALKLFRQAEPSA